MIDHNHDLPVVRQCKILELARSTAYYTPKPTSSEDLALMRRMDELHLEFPFAGSRMLRDLLRNKGQPVGRKGIRRLMKQMGIEALYRKTEHKSQARRTSDLPLPAAQPEHRAAQSRLGNRHHVHPDAPGLRLSGCHR